MIAASRREALLFGASAAALASASTVSGGAEPQIDWIVRRTMAAFDVPGVGVAIIRPGVPTFLAGYGVRTLGKPQPVDRATLFGIASNSKSFTAAMLAMLVDKGRIAWDDPVIKHLPEFAMSDPQVTRMMSVRDLLVHRSGLALGAGDLMEFPTSNRTAQEVLRGLKYLPLQRGFRSGYAYDNILYIVAGLLLEALTGMSWADNVRTRIFQPLGMRTALPFLDPPDEPNVAGRHARLGPPVRGLGPQRVIEPDEGPLIAPAGGIQASVTDITRWLQVQLGKGQIPGGPRLWSEKQAAELWTPQVITSAGPGPSKDEPTRSVITGYALGWFIQEYRSRRLIAHSAAAQRPGHAHRLLPRGRNRRRSVRPMLKTVLRRPQSATPFSTTSLRRRRSIGSVGPNAKWRRTRRKSAKRSPAVPWLPQPAARAFHSAPMSADIAIPGTETS